MAFAKTREILKRGTRAAQPVASSVQTGTLYYVTDESITERSNGVTWDGFADKGTTTFIGLTDTPATYVGQAGKLVSVNAAANALEFIEFTNEQILYYNGTKVVGSPELLFVGNMVEFGNIGLKFVGNGVTGQATIFKNAVNGLSIRGFGGTTYDTTIISSASDTSLVWAVKSGDINSIFFGNIGISIGMGNFSPVAPIHALVDDATTVITDISPQLLFHNANGSGGTGAFIAFRSTDGNGISVNTVRIGAIHITKTIGALTSDFVVITTNAGTVAEAFRIRGNGNVGIGVNPGARLEIRAGTATVAAMRLTSAVNLTVPETGATEYDGSAFYDTADITSGRRYRSNYHIFKLTANGTAIGPGIADFFGANSAFPTVAGAVYKFIFHLYYLKTTAGTVTYTLTNTQTYTNLVANYIQTIVGGIGTNGNRTGAGIAGVTAAASALPATASLTTAVNHHCIIEVLAEINLAGNIRLRVTSSAGTITPLRGSYYIVERIPTANVGTFAA